MLNAIYIEQVEAFPDTTITLTNGKKFVVKEDVDDVVQQIEQYYTKINIIGTHRETEGEESE